MAKRLVVGGGRNPEFPPLKRNDVALNIDIGSNGCAIAESARLLRDGGRLVIETGSLVPVNELRSHMQKAGFRYVKVTYKGYVRVTGRLRRL